MLSNAPCPVIGFVGESGSGKTTLLSKVIALLKQRGLRVTAIKHSHHRFDIDQPGKDSHTLRQSGADQVMIASNKRWALMVENEETQAEPRLDELLGHIQPGTAHVILVEGFKHEAFPKLVVFRQAAAKSPAPSLDEEALDENTIGVISDVSLDLPNGLVQLDINEPKQVADFILRHYSLHC